METRTKVGLVLGKFAPLHNGHMFLIEYALARVDRLYVLVYEAKETIDIDLPTRCNWVRKLYPQAMVIAGTNGPEQVGYTPEIMKLQEDYILKMMPEQITHFFSSEPYGKHVSEALKCENVQVDPGRVNVPLSATKVRTNMLESGYYLHPVVNRDVVRKVVFLGAESTGKSTLTAEMKSIFGTYGVEEYGREYWNKYHDENGELTAEQLVELAEIHRHREEAAYEKSYGLTFVDTNAITTWIYGEHYDRPSKELDALVEDCKNRYHLTIVCDTDVPFVQDGTRLPEKYRRQFQRELLWKLNDMDIEHYRIFGNLQDRVEVVKFLIKSKFGISV